MNNLTKRLEKRGWNKKEIVKAVGIIQTAKHNKGKKIILLEKFIYIILLIVILAANFAVSVALMPIFMAWGGAIIYFIVIVLGIIFGLLFELVIRSIEHLEKRHHMFLAIFIPLVAMANIFTILKIQYNLNSGLGISNINNPIMVSLVYAAFFVLPYIIYRFILKKEYYAID